MKKNGKVRVDYRLRRLTLMKLLDLWSGYLKKSFVKVDDGRVVDSDECGRCRKRMSLIDEEIRRREGGVGYRYKAGFHRKEGYNIKKVERGFKSKGKFWQGGVIK